GKGRGCCSSSTTLYCSHVRKKKSGNPKFFKTGSISSNSKGARIMKKGLLCLCILTSILLSQIPVAYAADCDPPGTVYRSGCPREVLYSSNCDASADPCVNFLLGPKPITKTQTKTITWANKSDVVTLGATGDGQIGCKWYCDNTNAFNKCWPAFNTPMVTQTSWSQRVDYMITTCLDICSFPYNHC